MLRKILFLFLFLSLSCFGQGGFEFESDKSKITIPFQLVNNVILIPLTVNGVTLNFLVDTGVEETLLFSLDDVDEIVFATTETVTLKGLGSAKPIQGLKTMHNKVSVNGFTDKDQMIYVVTDQGFNLSSHLGIPINGIIGHRFFKNHLIEINYQRKKLTIYRDLHAWKPRARKSFSTVPIAIELNKPYCLAQCAVQEPVFEAKLLIDTGNSDALWLFTDQSEKIQVPELKIRDYLGRGFSGEIHGDRARITRFELADYVFENPLTSFPYPGSLQQVNMVKDRVGSIGGEILRRFTVVLDYKGKTMYLKKNASFHDEFHYNMSGMVVEHSGMQWIQEKVPMHAMANSYNPVLTANGSNFSNQFTYKFNLKPTYRISEVRKNSPAHEAGLLQDDVILEINRRTAHRYSLVEINQLLKSEEGKKLRIKIDRKGVIQEFTFVLRSQL